jgi:molybdopterin biosynthesis enzyme MoaB
MAHEHEVRNLPLSVGVLAIGREGASALAATVRDLERLWGPRGTLAVEALAVGDDPAAVERAIRRWSGRGGRSVVCTIGRSGHRREDFVPELTARLLTRSLPGVEERMYLASPRRPEDLLFRGRAGIRGRTLVVNLPARAPRIRAILAFLAAVVPHAVEKIGGSDRPCGGGDAG